MDSVLNSKKKIGQCPAWGYYDLGLALALVPGHAGHQLLSATVREKKKGQSFALQDLRPQRKRVVLPERLLVHIFAPPSL